MEKGKNSDLMIKGFTFHIQTEDWGRDNPFFVSHIFKNGAVIKTLKIPYTKVLPLGAESNASSIRIALEAQHEAILDLLISGQFTSE